MSSCRFIGRPWMRQYQMYPWRPMDNRERCARWAAVWDGDRPRNSHPWKWLRKKTEVDHA